MAGIYASFPPSGGGGGAVPTYPNLAAFPSAALVGNGSLAIALDTDILYISDGAAWEPIGGPGVALGVGTIDTGTPSANGAHIDANQLIMQSASATAPGVVNTSAQTLAGVKTFSSAPIISPLTANTAIVSDGSKALTSSVTTATEIGYVSGVTSSIQTQLNGKQATLTPGSISTSTTGVSVGSGTASTVGPNVTVNVQTASGSQPGLLSAADWTTFNGKQASGNYITALTGDVTATGPGSVASTVAKIAGTTVSGTTGSGNVVFSNSPALTTPTLGAATATSVNKVTITTPASGSTITVVDGKTLTASNTLTFSGTDGSTVACGAGGTVLYNGGALGTPSSGTLSSCTGLPITGGTTGTLTIARGGTNSVTSLNNNRVMQSSGGAIVEAAAITASRALVSDSNGIPVASSTSTTQVQYLSAATGTTGTTSTNVVFSAAPTLTGACTIGSATSAQAILGSVTMAYNSVTFFTLDSNGNVLIGPSNGSNGPLRVQSNAGAASSGDPVIVAQYSTDTNCTGGYFIDCRNSSGSTIGRIEATANTTTSFTGTSDSRLKQDPKEFDGLAMISTMIPRQYGWKSDPGTRVHGFYAQELHRVLPEAVSVGNDELTKSGDLKTPWGIDYGRLTPILVRAIQQLAAEVEAIKSQKGS